MSFSFYQTTRCYISEDGKIHRLLLDLLLDFHTICTEMPHISIIDISQYYDFSATTTIYKHTKFVLCKFPRFQSKDCSEYSRLDASTE
jgi:hypothetical protein